MDQLLSVPELADYLGVAPSVIYGLRHRSEAPPALRIGRELRFRQTDVEEWLESLFDNEDRRDPAA